MTQSLLYDEGEDDLHEADNNDEMDDDDEVGMLRDEHDYEVILINDIADELQIHIHLEVQLIYDDEVNDDELELIE